MKYFTLTVLRNKLRKVGLIGEDNKPVLYSTFKNIASIHRYKGGGKGNLKVVFVGTPKDNLFAFYAVRNNEPDVNVMREAYANLCAIAKGDLEPHLKGHVQWGNVGIPTTWGDLKAH